MRSGALFTGDRKDSNSEPIFILGGGPGKSNLWREMPEAFYAHNDVVNVGCRGVSGEVKLKCPEIGIAMATDYLLSHDALLEFRKTLRRSCDRLPAEGVDINGYTMLEVVEDLEAVRRALGYEKINLFTTRYGTQVAYLYCLRCPSLGFSVESMWSHKSNKEFSTTQKLVWDRVRQTIDSGYACYGFHLDSPIRSLIIGYDEIGYYYKGWEAERGKGPVYWYELG